MGTLATGSIVLVPFPFSDLSQLKFRPAVVLAEANLFTANRSILSVGVGILKSEILTKIIAVIVQTLRTGSSPQK